MKRRVVVTGIGPVTGIGIGKAEFFSNIMNGRTNIQAIPERYDRTYRFKSRFYVPMPEFTLSDYGIPESMSGIMESISKLSVLGTRLALEDAGYSLEAGDRCFSVNGIEDSAIVVGVGMSSLQTALKSYIAHEFDGNNALLEACNQNARYNRMVIPMLMPNAAAAWISILFGVKGPNHTINASCASGTFAVGEAYRKIADGYCDTAITGGVECLKEENGAIMRGFDMLTALTKSGDGLPMPFSKQRSGFLFNEGAGCILILEEYEQAQKRGARIYAEICGYECTSDAYNIVQMDDSGEQIALMLNKLLAGRKPDYINAHGTGTLPNDEIECGIIQKVFGNKEDQPLINSTKGILGHSIGASGALEAAVTALSIYESLVHGNITRDTMENLNLAEETTEAQLDYAVSTSYGFGGHNGAILFKRVK